MAKEHVVSITNGIGSKELDNGNYTVTASIVGYDNASIDPASQEVTEGVDDYSFTIAATGTLTLHVSDDGTDIGVPIIGATFYRCDSEGNTYGGPIESNEDGNAIFNNVPFAESDAPVIYYKQTLSDGEHTFDDTLQNITLTEETMTVEITNPEAAVRNFKLTDANYTDLPIADGTITLSSE